MYKFKPWYIPTRWPDGSDKPKPMGVILNEVLHRLERIEKASVRGLDDHSTNRLATFTTNEIQAELSRRIKTKT